MKPSLAYSPSWVCRLRGGDLEAFGEFAAAPVTVGVGGHQGGDALPPGGPEHPEGPPGYGLWRRRAASPPTMISSRPGRAGNPVPAGPCERKRRVPGAQRRDGLPL
jgi:hypothetical protein